MDESGAGLKVLFGSSRGRIRPALFGRPSWSPDGSKLAIATDVGFARGFGPLYVLNADGSGPHELPGTAEAVEPVWSPDGSDLVFARLGKGKLRFFTANLWSVRVDGTALHPLTEPVRNQFDMPGSWSPDGSMLAFTRVRLREPDSAATDRSESAIYVIGRDGTGLRKLADRSASPAWSPDGRRIAFTSERDENGELSYGDSTTYANELYLMKADGTDVRRISHTTDLNEWNPSWSPDGRRIAFQRGKVIGNAQGTIVLVANADGTCPTAIAADPRLDTWYSSPAWRPGSVQGGHPQLNCRRQESSRAR